MPLSIVHVWGNAYIRPKHYAGGQKENHYTILMHGFAILNFAKLDLEVELHLRTPPLLLAILATEPPKSSSL